MAKNLNVMQIIWHDLGRHLSCYRDSDTVESPNIDKMSAEGVLFESHFSTGTSCVPSRSSILTGRYPHANELLYFNEEEVTLPKTLRDAGYETYRFGFREEREYRGFGREMDLDKAAKDVLGYDNTWNESRDSMDIADKTCEFLTEMQKYQTERPFFACVAFYDIHRPNEIDIDEETINNTKIPRILPDLLDTYESKKDIAKFEKRVTRADEAVGKILECLRLQELDKDTIVFFTSDHGLDLPRAKMTVYDPGIEVPLIFWGADIISKGKIDRNLHSHMDIFPTLLDLLDIPIPNTIQGESFAPALLDEPYKPRDFIIAERAWEAEDDPVRAIRTNEFKYIRNFCPGWPSPIPPAYVNQVGAEIVGKIYNKPRPKEELYDLINDPHEKNNLAEETEFQNVKAELCQELFDILKRDNDPVLSLESYLAYYKEIHSNRWIKDDKGIFQLMDK